MGGVSSRILSATGLRGLINKAGLPLQVDDDFDSSAVKEPSKVRAGLCCTAGLMSCALCIEKTTQGDRYHPEPQAGSPVSLAALGSWARLMGKKRNPGYSLM